METKQVVKKAAVISRRYLSKIGIGRKEKVFAIGYNKSASTSLHTLFQSLGLRSYHGEAWRQQDNLALLQEYDCFSDGTPRDLAELDRLFPNSKYILNLRDLEGWIYSRLAHIERLKKSPRSHKIKPIWDATEEAIKLWIQQRNEYHLSVLSFFADRPDDILVVNFIRDELAAEKVCRFLGYEQNFQNPKKNVNPSKERPKQHTQMLHRCVEALGISKQDLYYDIYCPSIEKEETRTMFPPDSSMLRGYVGNSGNSLIA